MLSQNKDAVKSEMVKITHQDVGQMDMYVRMYDERFKTCCTHRKPNLLYYFALSEIRKEWSLWVSCTESARW